MISRELHTHKALRTGTVVGGDSIVTHSPVETGRRPTLVPVGLTVSPRVAVYAVTGERAVEIDNCC